MSGSRVFGGTCWSLLVAACVGCFELTDPLPPAERHLLVHAVLEAGAPFYTVAVERTGDGGTGFAEPVDAQVAVILPDGRELTFSPGRPGVYHYLVPGGTNPAPVVPGKTYALLVQAASGEVVTGTTTVPTSQPTTSETAYLPFDIRDTLRLTWPRVPGAKSYHVSVQQRHGAPSPGTAPDFSLRYQTFADTSIALPGNLKVIDDGNVFSPGDSVFVVVSAVDDNFYTYYHGSLDPFAGAPPSRLSGGIGVFGSTVPLIHRRYRVVIGN